MYHDAELGPLVHTGCGIYKKSVNHDRRVIILLEIVGKYAQNVAIDVFMSCANSAKWSEFLKL